MSKAYNMKNSKYLLFFSLLAIMPSLTSCFQPKSIVKVEPSDPDLRWSYGKQLIRQQHDDLAMQVYFDTYTKKHLLFTVELANRGNGTVLVKPEDFYLKCTETDEVRLAYDPENVILLNKIDQSRSEARSKNIAVALGVATVATVAAVVASDGGGNNNNDNNNNDFFYVNNTVVVPAPAPVLPPADDFWENYSLRKTTLDPDFKVSGSVVLPRIDQCPNFDLYLPLGDVVFKAKFKQILIKP